MANDLYFEDNKHTLATVLKTSGLPVVVRVCEDNKIEDDFDICRSKINGNTEIFLQQKLKVKYGLIKVLKNYDNDAVQKEKGPEYVLEHDTYVDEQFLIPLKYSGKVKFVHRPGKRRRYATISQVISELPRYIIVGEETVAFPPNGIGKNVIVPAKTKLEVVRKFKQPNDNSVYIECSDGSVSYSFGERDRINCTEVDDTKLYHLFELVRCKMLPKVILFQNVAPEDVILMDNELNSAMLTCVEGPIELLGFTDVDMIVGWVRNKESKTYKTVLIPDGLWNILVVQERSLHGEEEKAKYIEQRYKPCGHIGFVENKLYWMSKDKCHVTWIRSPDFYKRTVNGNHMFEPITVDFQDSSDEESPILYDEIFEKPPAVPERHPIHHKNHHDHLKRGHEKKSLFHKVHRELLGKFKHSLAKSFRFEKRPPAVPKRPHRLQSTESNDDDTVDFGNHFSHTNTEACAPNSRTMVQTVSDNHVNSLDSDIYQYGLSPGSDNETDDYDYDYPDVDQMTPMFRAATQNRPLPRLPRERQTADDTICTPTTRELPTSGGESPTYVSLTMKQAEHLFRDNLTEKDFFQYTITETAHCFKHCGLEDFAEKCRENRLDGSFFNNFDLDELKKHPFNLTSFHVLKVTKMIYDGWRPKVFK